MPATVPLASLADLKAFLDIRAGATQFDAKLSTLAVSATGLLEQFTRREFQSQEYTEYFATSCTSSSDVDLTGWGESGRTVTTREQTFPLKAGPVDEAETFEVYYDPTRQFGTVALLTKDTHWYFDEAKNTVVLLCGTGTVSKALKVVYTAGYAKAGTPESMSAACPPDLKMACVLQTIYMFNRTESGAIGVVKVEEGEEAVLPKALLIPEAQDLARRYVRYLVARG